MKPDDLDRRLLAVAEHDARRSSLPEPQGLPALAGFGSLEECVIPSEGQCR